MSSRALYRKYRSKSLKEVIGQEPIVQVLTGAIKQNKISHAYLFTGPRGTGKTSIARIFAHDINGLAYETEKTHLDIIEIDAASNRSIDNIRDLKEKLSSAPTELKFKVYIIDEVHMLTTESFNALLKTIEEPPSHAIFILATTDAHKVPATIMSRVQKFYFKPIDLSLVQKHLASICKKEEIKAEPAALEQIAISSEGSMRDALSLLDQLTASSQDLSLELVQQTLGIGDEKNIQRLSEAVQSGQTETISKLIQELTKSGVSPNSIGAQIYQELKLKLSSYQELDILSELITLGQHLKPALNLELALLKLASLQQKGESAVATKAPTKAEAPKALEIPQEVLSEANTKLKERLKEDEPKKPKIVKEVGQSDEEDKPEGVNTKLKKIEPRELEQVWSDTSIALAKKSPSLKAVLTKANLELTKDYQLKLTFKFQIHFKLADDAKNHKLITDCFSELGITPPKLNFVLDKNIPQPVAKKTAPTPKPADKGDLSDIIGLMGGGDMIEV